MRALSICILLVAGTSLARADDGAMSRGAGATTCAKFGAAYGKNPEAVELVFFPWAQGFMSASNIALALAGSKQYRDLGGATEPQQAKIRAYCRENPKDNFSDSVMNLFRSLPLKNIN
jgi:hypothetical protein